MKEKLKLREPANFRFLFCYASNLIPHNYSEKWGTSHFIYFQNPFPIFRSIPRKLKWIRNFPLHMCSIIYFNITSQLIQERTHLSICCCCCQPPPLYHCNWTKVKKKSRLYGTENHRIASSNQQQPTWFWLLLFYVFYP